MKFRSLILFIMIAVTSAANGQTRGNVRIQNDTVFYKNNPELIIKNESKAAQSLYFIASMDKKPQLAVFFSDQDSAIKCSVRFPSLSKRYDVLYPKIDISVLIESYYKNKVIKNGVIDSVGLAKYCKERKVELKHMTGRKPNHTDINDSAMAMKAKEDYESQIAFVVTNNSALQLNLKIGSAASNRIVILNAAQSTNQRARAGESVCVIDNNKVSKGCIEVKKGMKKIIISADGKLIQE